MTGTPRSAAIDGPAHHQRLRPELFLLDPGVVHLNHGSFGAVPIPVLQEQRTVLEAIERSPERFYRADLPTALGAVRRQVAAFLRTDPEGLALVQNATEAVQVVLESVGLGQGDEIVYTDHTYRWVQTAIARACERYGAVARPVQLPHEAEPATFNEAFIASFQAAISERTALVVVDQITSASALPLPVAELISALPGHVPVLVDAAHAPGLIERPVPEGAAFWLGNLHKWAFSARTAAALVVAPSWRQRVRPLVASAGAAEGYPHSFTYLGTQDPSAYLALPAALEFPTKHLGMTFEQLKLRNAALLDEGMELLSERLGLAPPRPTGLPLNAIDLGTPADEQAAARATEALRAEGIEVAMTSVWGRLHARVSVQAYVALTDFDGLAVALKPYVRG